MASGDKTSIALAGSDGASLCPCVAVFVRNMGGGGKCGYEEGLKGVVLVDLEDLEEEGMAVVEEVGGMGSLFIMEVATVFKALLEWDTMLVLEEVIMEVADLVVVDLEGMVGWEGQGISSSMELCQEWDTL